MHFIIYVFIIYLKFFLWQRTATATFIINIINWVYSGERFFKNKIVFLVGGWDNYMTFWIYDYL